MTIMEGHGITRRSALGVLGAAAAMTLGRAPLATAQGAAHPRGAAPALGVQEPVADGLKRIFGSRGFKDGAGIVKLEVPLIAENGAVVPVSVEVDSPMTPASHVTHIYVVADKNPIPIVTRVALSREAGVAYAGANIRLAETADVRAIAEFHDGTLLQVKREVRVTFSGCAGPA